MGVALVVLALISVPWLVPVTRGATDVRDSIVRGLGAFVFLLVFLLAFLGWLVLRRRLAEAFERWQPWAIALLWVAFAMGLASFFRPAWQLGETSLTDVTAGGELGQLLTGSVLAIFAWLTLGVAAFSATWPALALAIVQRTPDVLRVVWNWRIPQRTYHGVRATFEVVFPTRTSPEATQRVPLDTLTGGVRSAVETLERPEDLDEYEDQGEQDYEAEEEEEIEGDEGVQAELPLEDGDEPEGIIADEVIGPPPRKRRTDDGWQLPPLELLADVALEQTGQPDNALRAGLIVETLGSFGVDAKIVQINEGPTVTQFGIEPGWEVKYRQAQERDAQGRPLLDKDGRPKMRTEEVSRTRVRVNQITSLANDLALALAAPSIRIESPVPGKPFVGIEVPNTTSSLVALKSVIDSPQFKRLGSRSKLTIALGKSVSGDPVVADLTKMPHLLIAGATGSGKSVCINSIITCILMHASPEDVRFVIIDPKRVELSQFATIPHLAFSSIIVDVDKVPGTLQAIIHEMDTRYRRFAALAVRNIEGYNRSPKVAQKLPYWVVIIDELADLMMAAPYEVERQVTRLAQLARATGIHLIIATQRPSVDVVTGLIKANFPTRVAFAVSSQVDSRTILDMAGAEKLLGRGDMLYMPTDAAKPKRLQGVFVSDAEIDRVVGFWTQDRFQELERETFDHLFEEVKAETREEMDDDDPMLEKARQLALEHNRISTSLLQRRLRIGYPRAARIMDQLEEEGLVGAVTAGGSREVVRHQWASVSAPAGDGDE